jgi:hypothetical protein
MIVVFVVTVSFYSVLFGRHAARLTKRWRDVRLLYIYVIHPSVLCEKFQRKLDIRAISEAIKLPSLSMKMEGE